MFKNTEEYVPFIDKKRESALPLKISWQDLKYTVKTKLTKVQREAEGTSSKHFNKEILKAQSGYIQAGETCFIMGASGAGKTTLLNALCDRLTNNKNCKLQGKILLNDSHTVSQRDFGKYGAYVMQDDVLFPTLTCEEVITFSARLKLNLTGERLASKVNGIIDNLGLSKCRKTYIGNQRMRGLSGGERKRTSIAVEMITDPQILFLDEPTSGLDSFTAQKIVAILKKQANLGKTVLATIHQPNSSTFALFDRLILLMEGHQIYQGSAKASADYFEDLGFVIPKYSNPSDFYLKQFFIPFKKSEKDINKMELLINRYQQILAPKVKKEEQMLTSYEEITSQDLAQSFRHAGFFVELKEVVKRSCKNIARDPVLVKMRTVQTLVIAIMSCLIFWQMGYGEKGAKNKAGFMFFMSINQFMTGMFTVLITFLNERGVFLREYASKTYGLATYFLSKSVIETPFQFIFPIIISAIVYFAAGLEPEFTRFLIFTVTLIAMVF